MGRPPFVRCVLRSMRLAAIGPAAWPLPARRQGVGGERPTPLDHSSILCHSAQGSLECPRQPSGDGDVHPRPSAVARDIPGGVEALWPRRQRLLAPTSAPTSPREPLKGATASTLPYGRRALNRRGRISNCAVFEGPREAGLYGRARGSMQNAPAEVQSWPVARLPRSSWPNVSGESIRGRSIEVVRFENTKGYNCWSNQVITR